MEVSAGDDVKDLAGFGAEDARKMLGLRTGECRVSLRPGVGDSAASCHRM